MSEIRLRLPNEAANLIVTHGMAGIRTFYDSFVEYGVLRTIELLTFGLEIWPIINNYDGREVGHVTYWNNKMVTVSELDGDNNSLLLRVIEWGNKPLSADECTRIWNGVHTAVSGELA